MFKYMKQNLLNNTKCGNIAAAFLHKWAISMLMKYQL